MADRDGDFYFLCDSTGTLAAENAARHIGHKAIDNSYVNKFDVVDGEMTWFSRGYNGGYNRTSDPFRLSWDAGGPTMFSTGRGVEHLAVGCYRDPGEQCLARPSCRC